MATYEQLISRGILLGERPEKLEQAWSEELECFTDGGFLGLKDELREELAYLFENEVPDEKKSSPSWSLYEIMNCLDDRDLERFDCNIVKVAYELQTLITRWKAVVRRYGIK